MYIPCTLRDLSVRHLMVPATYRTVTRSLTVQVVRGHRSVVASWTRCSASVPQIILCVSSWSPHGSAFGPYLPMRAMFCHSSRWVRDTPAHFPPSDRFFSAATTSCTPRSPRIVCRPHRPRIERGCTLTCPAHRRIRAPFTVGQVYSPPRSCSAVRSVRVQP
ncbi:hypothetical protein C8Q77DRAFT_923086 [Trametes polyzona]|nr:hypothetical protein C8Q77DRAFT_923086 [Trametes polyzona]